MQLHERWYIIWKIADKSGCGIQSINHVPTTRELEDLQIRIAEEYNVSISDVRVQPHTEGVPA